MPNQSYCKVCKKCNGCQLSNLDYESQLRFKQALMRKTFNNIAKCRRILPSPQSLHYRNKAQIVFKKEKNGKISFGIYQSAEKGITTTNYCPLHTERANKLSSALCGLFEEFSLEPYDFHRKKGFMRSALIREGFSSGEVLVNLVCSKNSFGKEKEFAEKLLSLCPFVTSVIISESGSAKLTAGAHPRCIWGKDTIKDTLCGLDFEIGHSTFYQINPVQTQRLYSTAIDMAELSSTDTVLDAYCGIGTIGLIAAEKCKEVVGIELNESSIENAIKNADKNNVQNVRFFASDVKKKIKELLKAGNRFDVCIVDPPRIGCDIEFLKSIIRADIPKIIYISCNPDTQARDIRFLIKNGYKVKSLQGVDMFPYTKHVESIALLTKA